MTGTDARVGLVLIDGRLIAHQVFAGTSKGTSTVAEVVQGPATQAPADASRVLRGGPRAGRPAPVRGVFAGAAAAAAWAAALRGASGSERVRSRAERTGAGDRHYFLETTEARLNAVEAVQEYERLG